MTVVVPYHLDQRLNGFSAAVGGDREVTADVLPGEHPWDAHADFHTEATTTSGYLGGMPLALAAGLGTLTLPTALGLRPVPQSRIVLVDARDTDPPEHDLLQRSAVRRAGVADLDDVPEGDLYLHVD